MILSKKSASYFSLAAIILYWTYSIFKGESADLPKDFFELVGIIILVKIIHFTVVYFLLRLEGDGFKQLGFGGPDVYKQILRGFLYGVGAFVIANILINSIILNTLNPTPSGHGVDMTTYFTNWINVSVFIFIGIAGGGFVEEFERIFVLTRFQNWLGRPGLFLALVISSVFFGMAHYYQGFNSAITAGISGLIFGLVYIRKGSAVEAVACHATYDVIGIIIGYFLAQGS